MSNPSWTKSEEGFTLVEVLVTVLILGLLAAVVFPVVIGQVDKADPTAVSNDLANFRSGIELFQLDLRPADPGDLEDLINQPDANDQTVDGGSINNPSDRWEGPYVDATHTDVDVAATSEDTKSSGFDATILTDLRTFNSASNTEDIASTEASGEDDFIAIRMVGMDSTQFADVNEQIDGDGETDEADEGRVRFLDSDNSINPAADTTYFLVVPFRN